MELATWNTWDSFYPQEKLPLRYNNSLEEQHCLGSGRWQTSESLYSIVAKEFGPCLGFCQAVNHVLLYGTGGSTMPCLVRHTPPLLTKDHFWLWLDLSSRHSHTIFLTCWTCRTQSREKVFDAVGPFWLESSINTVNVEESWNRDWFTCCSHKNLGPLSLPDETQQFLTTVKVYERKKHFQW